MRTLRWMLPALALALFPAACTTDGDEAGDETIIVEDQEPDIVIEEDRPPDVIVDERDDGFEAEIGVDEDGNVEGNIRVEDE